eukprot:11239072-Karenia_brevis.AAC.1
MASLLLRRIRFSAAISACKKGAQWQPRPQKFMASLLLMMISFNAAVSAVSYTHLTLPTICSV